MYNPPTAPPCSCNCHLCMCSCHGGTTPPPVERWHTGVCDMAGDLNNCLVTCFCPCITFGHNVAALDQGHSTSCMQAGSIWFGLLMIGLPCFCSGYWRKALRTSLNIPSGECGDYCLHFWCGPCALCQEHCELRIRGLMPGTSQEGQAAKPTIPPPVAPGMRRF